MDSQNRTDGIEIPPDAVAELTRLYERGLYVQACSFAATLPPVAQWRGTEACIIGGRLANNVHASRLARWLHGKAWRRDKNNPEAAYYFAGVLRNWRGPLAAWKFLNKLPAFADASDERRADLLTIKAGVLGSFRDFDSATKLLDEAAQLNGGRPWYWVEKGSLYEQQDAYEEALAASWHALELQPWFRPAIQAAAHQLQLLSRDEEALTLLQSALERLESPAVAGQLALLQTELGQHSAALLSWQRLRELAPWMEPDVIKWWEARMSDTHYFAGDLASAADAAERSENRFHQELVPRLRAPAPDARRVLLPVGFVRQHHFTCAPATLSALSRYWNMPVDHLALADAICYDGTPDHVERHWAGENGWQAREFRVTWEVLVTLIDRGVPFTLTTVETQSAHLQAVIGYDSFRHTILVRDPYERTHGEWPATEFLERYAASGPRGMLLVPPAEGARLDGIDLPDATLYDEYYKVRRALHTYDRALAQQHLEALEIAAPTHRLTRHAQRTVAGYDGSLPRQLAAVEELLALYPKNGNFQWNKYVLLRELTRRADYQEFLQQRCADPDSEPLFWREWAVELNADARRRSEAERILRRALHHRPTDPDLLHARANLHWDAREFGAATALYRLAATLRDKVDGYSRSYFLAARHLRQTDIVLALLTRRFDEFSPQSSQPTRLLFWALTILDRQTEAFDKLERALALRPNDGELLLFAADAFARHGNAGRGGALLESAEKLAPRGAWLRTAAGLADYRCDLSAALALWREVLTEEPLFMEAQRAVTRLLAETQGRDVALAHLSATCARFEHHIGLHELWAEWARGESNAAVEPVLRRLLALHPEHAWAHRELASVCSSLHRPDEAGASLAIAEQLEPHVPSTAGVRAQVALEAGRLEEARDQARAALRLSVDYESAIHTLLAASPTFSEKKAAIAFIRDELIRQVVFGDGLLAFRTVAYEVIDPPELLAILRDARTARPDLWHAWSAVVLQLVDMQQLDEALTYAREATERFPLLPRLWLDLARVQRALGHREQEIPPLQRALHLAPAWGLASRQLADTHQRMGQYQEAAEVLERAIAAAPLDPYNHGCLADALHHLRRDDEAAAKLDHALKLEPGYDWAWDALRAWSPEKGERNRASVLARELTRLRAGEARSWYILALSLVGAPLGEKLDALDRAITLHPRFAAAHDVRAQWLAEAGRFDEAQAACAPDTFGGEPPTLLRGRGAWIEAIRGRTRAAIARMRTIVAEAPDYYWGWNMLADWCCADRDFAGAEEAAGKMARLAPRSAIPLGYLADIQLKNGQEDAAYETLRRAFDIDPTYAFAGFALFDRHLGKGQLDDAGRVLGVLATHLPGARAQAAKVRLDARLDRRDSSLADLRELIRVPDADSPALHTAVKAMVEARWGLEVETVLSEALDQRGVNPEVGPIWVRRFAARGAWKARKRLYRLSPRSEIGRRARIAYIEELAAGGHTYYLGRQLSRERKVLQEIPSLWGTVGYAYVHLRQWKNAVKWMRDAGRRQDVEPWMLLNLSAALRELARNDEALAVNRRALTLTSDHTSAQHLLWVAFETAIAGRISTLDQELAELREHELGDYERTLLALVKALRAMHTALPADRPRVFREQRDGIEQLYQRGKFANTVLNRTRRRCLTALSRFSGDRWRWLRPLLPERAAPRASSPPLPSGAARLAIIVFAMLILNLMRNCNETDYRATPVLPPSIPIRTPAPHSTPSWPSSLRPAGQPSIRLMPPGNEPSFLPPVAPLYPQPSPTPQPRSLRP